MRAKLAGILAVLALLVACSAPVKPEASPIPVVASPTPTQQSVATPTFTPRPTPTATATPTPAPESGLPVPPDRDLFALAQRLVIKSRTPTPSVVNPTPVSYSEGRKDTFNVVDFQTRTTSAVNATLQLVTDHAYWYVDDSVSFSMDALKRSAATFEDQIYSRVTKAFDPELTPGVDNDVHLTILNTPLKRVAGYYSSVDEYPVQVLPFSNQREMIYIDTAAMAQGGSDYLGTLAHEFTHAVQFRTDPTEETWVNEGLAEFGRETAGYTPVFRSAFLASTLPVSLILWPMEVSGASSRSYGAASLFMDYLSTRYGPGSLRTLMDEPANGIRGVEAYLRAVQAGKTFRDVFADWIVADYINDPSGGVYGYPALGNARVTVTRTVTAPGSLSDSIPPYAAAYYDLRFQASSVKVTFQGQKETPLLPVEPSDGACWWSNRGDSIDSTLTGRFSLPSRDKLTLTYSLWYSLEDGWDFAYVEASTDGGATWDVLEGQRATRKDALGNAFGPGYTGVSGAWLRDNVDLTPYAGKDVLLRFEYVTDEAVNGQGLCLDDISIPETGFVDDAKAGNPVWDARGFLRTDDNRVSQDYVLRVIEIGAEATVRDISLGADRSATFTIDGLGSRVDHAVIVVASLADGTGQPATIQLDAGVPSPP